MFIINLRSSNQAQCFISVRRAQAAYLCPLEPPLHDVWKHLDKQSTRVSLMPNHVPQK